MPDAFRIIDEDGIYAEKRSATEWNIEHIVRKDRDAVALCCHHVTPSWKVLGVRTFGAGGITGMDRASISGPRGREREWPWQRPRGKLSTLTQIAPVLP